MIISRIIEFKINKIKEIILIKLRYYNENILIKKIKIDRRDFRFRSQILNLEKSFLNKNSVASNRRRRILTR